MAEHLLYRTVSPDRNTSWRSFRKWLIVCTGILLLFLVAVGSPVSASDVGGIILPDYHHIDITLAHNGGTNYIKFDGGGLNALHLTTTTSEPYGQVTMTQEESGIFYFSDTGGRGFFDDLILMLAVKGDVPDDYSIHIRASGYRWTPTPILNMPPTLENITYISGSIDDTFKKADFIYGPQSWRPYNGPDYPFYSGQGEGGAEETFQFMFVDLKVGAIGPNSFLDGLIDNGMAKIEYEIEGDPVFTVFNVYGWCNQSNQGRGISWTNDVSGLSESGRSGFSVLPPGGSSTGGDQAAAYGSSDVAGGTGETGSGYEGSALAQGEPVLLNGSVGIFPTEGAATTLEAYQSAEFRFNATLIPEGKLHEGFLYLYATGGENIISGKGAVPDLDVTLDGETLPQVRTYSDVMGESDGSLSITYVFNLPAGMAPGSHVLLLKNRSPGTKTTVSGGAALVIWEDESGTVSMVTTTEGCDIVRANPGRPQQEATTTSVFKDMTVPGRPDGAAVFLVSTGTNPVSPTPMRFFFNEEPINGTGPGGDQPVEVRSFNVTGLVKPSSNVLEVSVVPVEEKVRSITESRNAILVFTYNPGQQTVNNTAVPAGQQPEKEEAVPSVSGTLPVSTVATEPPVPAVKSTGPGSATEEDSLSMLPAPVRDFIKGIFAVLFAVGGVEEPAVDTSHVSAPAVVDTSQGTAPVTPGPSPGADSPESAAAEPSLQESVDEDQGMWNPTPPADLADDEWSTLATAATPPYGGIYINSIPGGSGITIDGKALNVDTPKTIFGLREGSHTVRISNEKALFFVTDQQVWIYRGLLTSVTFDIGPGMKKPVEVISGTYEGDSFTLNGKYPSYRIPAGVTLKKSGSYLTILHDGCYLSREISDYLNPMDNLEILPSPTAFGRILVKSDPAESDVLVDGFPSGLKTPCIVENLSEGRHTISLSMLGFLPEDRIFMIKDDPTREIDEEATFFLTPYAYGELNVKSTPPGATVLINRMNFRQTTPCTFSYMTIGSYSMKVTLGDKVRNVDFEIAPGMGTEYEFDFEHDTFIQREYRI